MLRSALASFILSFFAVTLMILMYVVLPQYLVEHYNQQASSKVQPFAAIIPSPTPRPTPGLAPATLIISKLNIQAGVEYVGLTASNNMDVPKQASHVAWYQHGPKPGEVGNAVIAGHYDTITGKPEIFYNLRKLHAGDEVVVISENAVRSTFVVTEIASIPYNVFPSEEVFKNRPGRNLNLITCGGIWDKKTKNYTERIVVYTTFKSST